jgi:hypothetical protein
VLDEDDSLLGYCAVLTASIIKTIALMMEAVRTSETSVNYETTQRNNPEGCHLHTRRSKKLKSHKMLDVFL